MRIVEERDASETEKAVREINSGVYCLQAPFLFSALRRVQRNNVQGEQYLTDVVALAVAEQHHIAHVTVADAQRVLGVNTHAELAYLETLLRQQQPG